MATTKLTEDLNIIQGLLNQPTEDAPTLKSMFDEAGNKIKTYINDTLTTELDDNFTTKSEITTNRKLSATGDFTGTLNGMAMTAAEPGLSIAFNAHLTDSAFDVKHPPLAPMVAAKGDGVTDDTIALQAIIDYCQTNNLTPYFPKGTYLITSALLYKTTDYIKILGENRFVKIKATQAMRSILETSFAQSTYFEISNILLDGNNFADYGLYGEKVDHLVADNSRIIGTKVSGLAIGYGWCNDLLGLVISDNYGNGIEFLNVGGLGNNNAVNIDRCKVFKNNGIGIKALHGSSFNITKSVIEMNKITGVYGADIGVLNIEDNYFEKNGELGMILGTHTIKADIILNGGEVGSYSSAFPVKVCHIEGNYTEGSSTIDTFVATTCSEGLDIKNNHSFNPKPILKSYVGLYNSIKNVKIGTNNNFSPAELVDIKTNVPNSCSTWEIDGAIKKNYLPMNALEYAKSEVKILNTSTYFKGCRVFKCLKTTDLSYNSYFVIPINIDKYPDLAGKAVYFGMWLKQSEVGMNVNINIGSQGGENYPSSILEWRYVENQIILPTSGTINITLILVTDKINTYFLFTNPVISIVGNKADKMTDEFILSNIAAPTDGDWLKGDRIINSNPTVGQPKSWICTVAGSPGTWVSDGNL